MATKPCPLQEPSTTKPPSSRNSYFAPHTLNFAFTFVQYFPVACSLSTIVMKDLVVRNQDARVISA